MASATLTAADRFPVGTSVSAYPVSNFLQSQLPPVGVPPGASAATAVVAADGSLAFTGLADNTRYYAYAQVGGADRYVQFRTPGLSGIGTAPGTNVTVGNSTGKVGFFGTAGVVRPAAYTQTFSTAARTVPAATSVAVATTAATSTTPFGFATQAQADAIPVAINALRTDLDALKQVVNALIDDLQALGLAQ